MPIKSDKIIYNLTPYNLIPVKSNLSLKVKIKTTKSKNNK